MSVPYPATDVMTIASGSNSSSLHLLEGCSLVKIQMPSALTGTKLTLQGSLDGTTFYGVTLDGSAVEYTWAANGFFEVNPRATLGLRYVRMASDGTEGASRTINAVIARVV